jgi:hypothetical protein
MANLQAWLVNNWKHIAATAIVCLGAVQATYNWPDPKLFGLITSLSVILGIYAGHNSTDKNHS